MSIDKHLDSRERIVLKFRPSRKSFLWEYLVFTFVMLLSFGFFFTTIFAGLKNNPIIATILTVFFYSFLLLSLILLIKVEYKIWSKAYAITNERMMISEGIFTEKFKSCVYSKITDLGLKQSFFDKIMNTGTVEIDTASSDVIELKLENISMPFDVKRIISDAQSAAAPSAATQTVPRPPHIHPAHHIKK